ncbi:ATPase component [Pseudomonas syringae pv. actinidiae]|uniref:ATPase component n=2 Tax=Pseudomonas syringae pv. actinidiae TaxID=103796 RepID=A0AAN4Q0Z6_PSESF|nr:ATPase component [Pseudomonas syringae pv. actinidiae]
MLFGYVNQWLGGQGRRASDLSGEKPMMINNGPHDKAQIDVSAATRSQERAICSRRLPCSHIRRIKSNPQMF